ncbi:MAG TPA: hypothetical protein VFO40_04830 [Chthoniobacterales bacterium]|nr:hypothetical protein [Chthoniobacterales bacterium]
MSYGTHEVTEFTSLLFRVLGSVPTGGFVPVTSPPWPSGKSRVWRSAVLFRRSQAAYLMRD